MPQAYKTSLYTATKRPEQKINYSDLYFELMSFLKALSLDCVKSIIEKNGNEISEYLIRLKDIQGVTDPSIKIRLYISKYKINLALVPYGSNISNWQNVTTTAMVRETLSIVDTMEESFIIKVAGDIYTFERQRLKDLIDISNWQIAINNGNPLQKNIYNLKFFWENKNIYKPYCYQIKEEINFYIYSAISENEIHDFIEILRNFGNIEFIKETDVVSWYKNKAKTDSKLVVIIIASKESIASTYKNVKEFFISQRIPTQFIRSENISNRFIKRDITTQILIKLGYSPLELKWPSENLKGSLVIDTSDPKNKIMGMLYISQDRTEEESFMLLDDIEYNNPGTDGKAKERNEVTLNSQNEEKLLNRTVSFIGRENVTVDLIITKNWKLENLSGLISGLAERKITIKNIYLLSLNYMRFISEFNLNKHESYEIPYLIKGSQVLIFVATTPSIYPTIFPIYFRKIILNDEEDNRIYDDDIKKIIWFTKKRMYRFNNFDKLKQPEPINLLHNANKLKIDAGQIFSVSDLI